MVAAGAVVAVVAAAAAGVVEVADAGEEVVGQKDAAAAEQARALATEERWWREWNEERLEWLANTTQMPLDAPLHCARRDKPAADTGSAVGTVGREKGTIDSSSARQEPTVAVVVACERAIAA